MSITWGRTRRAVTDQFLGIKYFMDDGVGASDANCGVDSPWYGANFETALQNGYGINPPESMDACIGYGYEVFCLERPFGRKAGTGYKIGTVAVGHPDEGDDITCQPWDQWQFLNQATGGAAHIAQMKASITARAANLQPIIIYQGSPIYTMGQNDVNFTLAVQMAIDLECDVALDACAECSRADTSLPAVSLSNTLAALYPDTRLLIEAWGRRDAADCLSWLDISAGAIATGKDGADLTFRADTGYSDQDGVWHGPNYIRNKSKPPIVMISYNDWDAVDRVRYVKLWLDRGCSVLFDPIGMSAAQLIELLRYWRTKVAVATGTPPKQYATTDTIVRPRTGRNTGRWKV